MKKISEVQTRDTGMALVLICLLGLFFGGHNLWLYTAFLILVLAMIWPELLTWPARIWFGFSQLLGSFVSRVILALLFFSIVTPVALVRRLLGADSLHLKNIKKTDRSAFTVREKSFSAADLERPY